MGTDGEIPLSFWRQWRVSTAEAKPPLHHRKQVQRVCCPCHPKEGDGSPPILYHSSGEEHTALHAKGPDPWHHLQGSCRRPLLETPQSCCQSMQPTQEFTSAQGSFRFPHSKQTALCTKGGARQRPEFESGQVSLHLEGQRATHL